MPQSLETRFIGTTSQIASASDLQINPQQACRRTRQIHSLKQKASTIYRVSFPRAVSGGTSSMKGRQRSFGQRKSMSTGMVMSSSGSLRCLRPVLLEALQQRKGGSYMAANLLTWLTWQQAVLTWLTWEQTVLTWLTWQQAVCLPSRFCQLLIIPIAIVMHHDQVKLHSICCALYFFAE